MNTIRKITKNVGVLFISQILSNVLGFFTLIYSARYLGVEGFGTLSLALAFTGILSVCMDMGLNTLTIREVARNNNLAKDYISNTIFLRAILSLITIIFLFIIVYIIGYNQQTIEVVLIIALYMILNTFTQMFYSIFQAFEKMEYQSIGIILNNVILLTGILLAIFYKVDIIKFSSVYALMAAITFFYSYIICYWKFFTPKMRFNQINHCKKLIRESWPFAITGISINIYIWIDTVILSTIQGQEAVGLYNASYKLILVLLFIPIVFNNALFPSMSKYYNSSKEALKISFEKLFKITMMIGIPIGIGTVLIANKVILLVYGDKYINATIALQILIWSTVLIFARGPFERLLAASNKQLTTTKIFIIGVIFNIILNLLIIPIYSYIGAAIVTVLTDILVLTLFIIAVKKSEFSISRSIYLSLIKIIISSIIMGLILSYFISLNLFLISILGIIIYTISLIALRILDDDEILMIKSIFY